ncbi:MAG: prenyltransferase/squalene oxidase repeat-containing protein [Actinomycetales bacterium]
MRPTSAGALARARLLAALLVMSCALLSVGITAPPVRAQSATRGLYGAADPQWDGAFRQALGILGLIAVGKQPSQDAVAWLVNQQCADGSYQAYRPALNQPCVPPDPEAGTGPQVDSTALAAVALLRVGTPATRRVATRALVWLSRQQRPDGGWPYIATGTSNANSTGLAMVAWRTASSLGLAEGNVNATRATAAISKGARFLSTLVQPCAAQDGAQLSYGPGTAPDWSATAQGALGLTGSLPVGGPRTLRVQAPCTGGTAARVDSALAQGLQRTPLLPSAFGTGPDHTSTAFGLLALVSAGKGRAGVTAAGRALSDSAVDYTKGSTGADPAAIGLLLMVAKASGADPNDFGGVNLVRLLLSSERR